MYSNIENRCLLCAYSNSRASKLNECWRIYKLSGVATFKTHVGKQFLNLIQVEVSDQCHIFKWRGIKNRIMIARVLLSVEFQSQLSLVFCEFVSDL